MKQEKVWDIIAPKWSKYRINPNPEVKSFLKNKKGKLLDLGCGSGKNLLKNKDLKIFCVDFSKEMLKFTEKNAKRKKISVNLIKSQAYKLLFKDNFFDNAIYIATLHCLETPEKRKKSLKELFRVLKPKSKVLITVWSRNSKRIKNHPKNTLVNWTVKEKKYKRYYYLYEKKELENIIKKIGFKIITSKENENIILTIQKP